MVNRSDQWGYRIPFALQWMWPIPIIIGVLFAPESPWWLVRKERREEAKHSLRRLTSRKEGNIDLDETIAMMEHTNTLEKVLSVGTSYWDCFKGTDLRRTEIVCIVWTIQTLCGSTFMGYSTYFYEQAGLATDNAFTLSMAQFALGAVGTIFSWFLMVWFGRRTLYLAGQIVMCILLVVIGGLGIISRTNTAAQWVIGSMLLIYTLTYDATVGPVCYSLVAELSSTRLRAKSIVLARNLYNVVGIVTNIITPRMLNPTAWNWGAKAGFFWAGTCFLCFIWSYFRLPEPKGRTYGELDILFERKVSARKFKSTIVDPFLPTHIRRESIAALEEKGKKTTIEHVEGSHMVA
jgi:SP family general alpha glucoside:H+ symporter-like MFS transporter